MTRPDSDDRSPPDRDAPILPERSLADGTLLRSRVESDLSVPFAAALDRELTGYAVLEPQDALLLDADGAGVVAFESGVPRSAYHTGTDRGGSAALADLAAPGPYDVTLRSLPTDDLAVDAPPDLRVPPGLVADRLAGDPDLAERTRETAPAEWRDGGDERPDDDADESLDAVEAFLDDEEKIAAIRDRAREEARERAEEWGLDGELQ
ncbi:hypothetical protein [Halorussus aquaticus]|uniref:DUF8054 domain-containing protein n=1 Tax=Halorussus aquaticus TaxID=2953748 RepID=A0ABD5Q1N3_9EURY|nr:hypothetical protein [Halorussus aquaticus]